MNKMQRLVRHLRAKGVPEDQIKKQRSMTLTYQAAQHRRQMRKAQQ